MNTPDAAFWLYAMECEGDLNTRTGKLNRFIKEYCKDPNLYHWDAEKQYALAHKCGFDLNVLSDKEIEYIEKEVERRIG